MNVTEKSTELAEICFCFRFLLIGLCLRFVFVRTCFESDLRLHIFFYCIETGFNVWLIYWLRSTHDFLSSL